MKLCSVGNLLRSREGPPNITNSGTLVLFFIQHYSCLRTIFKYGFEDSGMTWHCSRTERSILRYLYRDLQGISQGISYIFKIPLRPQPEPVAEPSQKLQPTKLPGK